MSAEKSQAPRLYLYLRNAIKRAGRLATRRLRREAKNRDEINERAAPPISPGIFLERETQLRAALQRRDRRRRKF